MQHHHDRISKLLAKYIQDTLDPDEKAELDEWVSASPSNAGFLNRLKTPGTLESAFDFFSGIDSEQAWEEISEKIAPRQDRPFSVSYRKYWWYAAAVLLLVGTWKTLLTYNNKSTGAGIALEAAGRDFAPGSNKAVLLLDNETRLVVEDLQDGIIYRENNLSIEKRDGVLRYHLSAKSGNAAERLHTLYTPVGGQFSLQLPDGTQVSLNAASSLTYPVSFPDRDRLVSLEGEAFFDVATSYRTGRSGIKKTFSVQSRDATVQVLGTQFNVNGYPDETTLKTTLIEGSVKVSAGEQSEILLPGQQAVVAAGGGIRLQEADTDEVIAWKNGYFQFEGQPLDQVLKQLQRWYGFETDDSAPIPSKHFTASISRNQSLSSVLRMLELSGGVRFEITDKKISVTGSGETLP